MIKRIGFYTAGLVEVTLDRISERDTRAFRVMVTIDQQPVVPDYADTLDEANAVVSEALAKGLAYA